MKIKRVECDQFAGVQDIDVEFSDGLNLVIGENESGKSTLADLIFQVLFKDTKLDGRSDAAFIDKYFPKKTKGPQGDVIDGTLVFATENGNYKLIKEWEKGNGSCQLVLPDKTKIKGADKITQILSEELGYGEGVFDEIVFASQKRQQSAIESIMRVLGKKNDPLVGTREALTSTLTRAALETGGVSLEKIERELTETLTAYTSNWDLESDAPRDWRKRGINNPWKNGVGKILASFYAMEEVRQAQINAETAETKVEECQKILKKARDEKMVFSNQKEQFQNYQLLIRQTAALNTELAHQVSDIKRMEEILEKWPREKANRSAAAELLHNQRDALVRERFLKVKTVRDAFEEKERVRNNLTEITDGDLKEARNLVSKRQKAEGKIAGLNLTAVIKQLGDQPIEVRNIASGTMIDISNEECHITEAVEITISGIMELQLIPQGVDVDQVRNEIRTTSDKIKEIFEKYHVLSLDELQEGYDAYSDADRKYKEAKQALEIILGDESWEHIEEENKSIIGEPVSKVEIQDKIAALCGSKSLDAYIGGIEKTLEDYAKTYESIESLAEAIKDLRQKSAKTEKDLAELDEIPVEYRNISDPDAYADSLRKQVEDSDGKVEEANENLRNAMRGLGELSAEEYSEDLLEKEAVFKANKAEYAHWKNIYDVFMRLKDQIGDNPMEGIETKFREYLNTISDGDIELTNIDEKMKVDLASGNHKLTYDILSNGTKDTISLAFRLAMLEHLYPDGNGLAIFDDAFTEMDPKRVEQSCRLIEKFAMNNQVVFITCDEKYKKLLRTNNVIEMSV